MALLQLGSRGLAVATLQTFLNGQGANPQLNPDGNFGPLTKAALAKWQGSNGLNADGVAGPLTQARIASAAVGTVAAQASQAIAAQQTAGVPTPKPQPKPTAATSKPVAPVTGILAPVHKIAPQVAKPAVAAVARQTEKVTTVIKETPLWLRMTGGVAIAIGTLSAIKNLFGHHKRT